MEYAFSTYSGKKISVYFGGRDWSRFSVKSNHVGVFIMEGFEQNTSLKNSLLGLLSCMDLPQRTDIVYVVPGETLGLNEYTGKNVVKSCLKFSGNYVIYDENGRHDAMIDKDSLRIIEGEFASFNSTPFLSYEGDDVSMFNQERLCNMVEQKTILAEIDFLLNLGLYVDNRSIWEYAESHLDEAAERLKAWYATLTGEESLPIPDEHVKDAMRRYFSIAYYPTGYFRECKLVSFPRLDNPSDLEYISVLDEKADLVVFARKVLKQQLEGCNIPFCISERYCPIATLDRPADYDVMRLLLDGLGVYGFIDAYKGGVPSEDLLA